MRHGNWSVRLGKVLRGWSPWLVAGVFFVAGVVFWGGFNWAMELSNQESFCISCHVMRDYVYQEYRHSGHYHNASGVGATCPDCHVPREWAHKVVRKVKATNELFHWAVGSIDTAEKFARRRPKLAIHVWQEMRETDSRECRNCHSESAMALAEQSRKAAGMHELAVQRRMTCIDCHQGVAHSLPAGFDREALFDDLHEALEAQGTPCYQCHEDVPVPQDDDEW